jgi:hypothetical protein
MDWKRFQEPSFIAAALACVLVIATNVLRPTPPLQSSTVGAVDPSTQSTEFEEALATAKSLLSKSDFAPAFDMVMVASRLGPSDPRLFDLVIQFIETAKPSINDDVVAMAEDLLDRGDSLVHFQSPNQVESSRKRLTDLRQAYFKSPNTPTPHTPFDSIRRLLAIAVNPDVPLSVRSRAAEQARSALDDARLDQVLSHPDEPTKIQSGELDELSDLIDNAEKQCIGNLFLQSKPKIDNWLSATQGLMKEIDRTPPGKVPDLSKRITEFVNQGFDCLQEVTPYSKSGVNGASSISDAVEKQIRLLQRQKNWLYNQQVLILVREIESKKDVPSEEKIRSLAEVSEEILSPYVLRRHNELWDKIFESLPDEEAKVKAVRLRILRLN